jgi:hypothetical protein
VCVYQHNVYMVYQYLYTCCEFTTCTWIQTCEGEGVVGLFEKCHNADSSAVEMKRNMSCALGERYTSDKLAVRTTYASFRITVVR